MRHPPPSYLSKLVWGGGRQEGGGGGGGYWQLGPGGGGGLRATHYYHMHTSRGCLGPWGCRGMYAIIAISRLCQKVLRVFRAKGIVPPSTKHGTKNLAPLARWPTHRYLSKLRGGGGLGGCRIQRPGPAAPPGDLYRERSPPPPVPTWTVPAPVSPSPRDERSPNDGHPRAGDGGGGRMQVNKALHTCIPWCACAPMCRQFVCPTHIKSGTDLPTASAGSRVIRRGLDLTGSDMGMRLVPTEWWVRQRRVLPSGTRDSADS